MKTTAPALMLRGIEEYGRGYLFVSRSIGVGSALQKALEGGAGMGAAGGFANAAGARQAAEAPVAGREKAACSAKRDEYATLREDCPTRSAAAGLRSGGKRVGVQAVHRATCSA